MTRSLATAQHEAAHVVVGCALGLRVKLAWVRDRNPPPPGAHPDDEGMVVWREPTPSLAYAVMCAAGVAWEALPGGDPHRARADRRLVREYLPKAPGGRADVRTAVALAAGLLEARASIHARVARMLAERDLTGRDLAAFVARIAPAALR